MTKAWMFLAAALWLAGLPAWGGGGGLNVIVVVNQASTNSVELGNYYCELRQVPPQNLVRIRWTGGNVEWTYADFTNYLLAPLLQTIAGRQLTNQAQYLLLSMDIPYRVYSPAGSYDSTTSALYYGFKEDSTPPQGAPPSCSLPPDSSNALAGAEIPFRNIAPGNLGWTNLLATMITHSNLDLAKRVVYQGAVSDATFPTQAVYLAKGSDVTRNIRYLMFDNTIFNTRLRGNYPMLPTSIAYPYDLGSIRGFQNGYCCFGIETTSFVPGSMADNLTSYGGLMFVDNPGQTSLLVFLTAGAAGSYGTIVEPCGYYEKFPSPQNYFYQSRGFTLAECFYQSVTNPYQGLLVGEPLAAPFAQPAAGAWNFLPSGALLAGTTNLEVRFTAGDARHPVQQVDLFLDGLYQQTLTNISPTGSNLLSVTLNGRPINYLVPLGADLQAVAEGLTAVLNTDANSNATKVVAFPHGDRIELQSLDITRPGAATTLVVSNSIGVGAAATTCLAASGSNFLDTIAAGFRNYVVDPGVVYPPAVGAWLQLTVTTTNGAVVKVGVTNSIAGTTVVALVSNLVVRLNAHPQLTGADGCIGDDFIDYAFWSGNTNNHRAEFNLRARSPGWAAAQLQAVLAGSLTSFSITPAGTWKLDENLPDLRPRAHLYVTAGVTNLPVNFAWNTTTQANGFHTLSAVSYEGSHVRTQKRIDQSIQVQNGPLSAIFTLVSGASNTLIGVPLQFSVMANTNNISKIELFSTGGPLTNVVGLSKATFTVAGADLGAGLHPFYAIVTAGGGQQYRTRTRWIRLLQPSALGTEPAFALSIGPVPVKMSWPATAGRTYTVLSATHPGGGFQPWGSVTPTNSPAVWTEASPSAPQRFYRVQTTN